MEIKKHVSAVSPFIRPKGNNFKINPFEAWKNMGGKIKSSHYPIRLFHFLAYKFDFPSIRFNKQQARLRFVEVQSLTFDTFPDYIFYEIIPFVWDCWPCLDNRMISWLQKHQVRTAIFTSEQAAERIKQRIPSMNILVITEGINTSIYNKGKALNERNIDLIEIGRSNRCVYNPDGLKNIKHVCTSSLNKRLTDQELFDMMADSKIIITLPKCDTDAQIGNGQETLTQRYWEAMLSRCVMIGHAPKELIDLIGYNPTLELDGFTSHRGMKGYTIEHLDNHTINKQISNVLSNISSYQELVNKNYMVALEMAPWTLRIKHIQEWLISLGYKI